MASEKILIVEDDKNLARIVELELRHEGYEVEKAFTGTDGLETAEKGDFALVLLDVMLPGMSGIEVLRRLRKSSEVPVILLTARGETADKVQGLDAGADDYIAKPFEFEEVLARIRARLRTAGAGTQDSKIMLKNGGITLELDADARTFFVRGQEVELTQKEFDLLYCLFENEGRVMSREALLSAVWGYDYLGETNVVDVYVRFLRVKIDEPFGIKLIKTVRGVGYKVCGEDAEAEKGEAEEGSK